MGIGGLASHVISLVRLAFNAGLICKAEDVYLAVSMIGTRVAVKLHTHNCKQLLYPIKTFSLPTPYATSFNAPGTSRASVFECGTDSVWTTNCLFSKCCLLSFNKVFNYRHCCEIKYHCWESIISRWLWPHTQQMTLINILFCEREKHRWCSSAPVKPIRALSQDFDYGCSMDFLLHLSSTIYSFFFF